MSVSEKLSDNFAIKTVAWSMASNFVLAIIKWMAGYFGHSYALIADAIESSTDVFTSFLLILASIFSISS